MNVHNCYDELINLYNDYKKYTDELSWDKNNNKNIFLRRMSDKTCVNALVSYISTLSKQDEC